MASNSSEQSRPKRRPRPLVPDHSRKRVRKACNPCRSNKLKCDGLTPCQRCRKASLACLFGDEQYNREISSPHPSERELFLENILQKLHVPVPRSLSDLKRYSESLTGSGNDGLRTDIAIVDVDRHVPTARTYVHDQGKTFFDAWCSAWAFFDCVRETVAGDGDSPVSHSKDKTTAYRHSILEPPNSSLNEFRSDLVTALPPRQVIDFLSSNYFRYSQSNFFVIHPAIFDRKLEAFFKGTHEFSPTETQATRRLIDFQCVLFMVLAIGAQFADLESEDPRSMTTEPMAAAILDISQISSPKPQVNPGWRFYEVSRRLLSEVVSSCSMTSIQACVLQGTFLITTSAHDVAYNMLGLAIRMAINMGLHRCVTTNSLHPQVQELRNRLWWSVYALERLFTFQMGRPVMINDDEIDTPFPEDLPGLQVPEYTNVVVDGQIALVRLYRIVGDIIKTIYPSILPPNHGRAIDVKSFNRLSTALTEWQEMLPNKLKCATSSTRGVTHLHLAYEHAVMLLYRLPLGQAVAAVNEETTQTPAKVEFLQNATIACLSAATSTVTLLQALRNRKLLCRFSCLDPLYCSAALHVLILGAKLEPGPPRDDTRRVMVEGILVLTELARGSETAASSLQHIKDAFRQLFPTTSSASSAREDTRSVTSRALGYEAWKNWTTNWPEPASSLSYVPVVAEPAPSPAILPTFTSTNKEDIGTYPDERLPPDATTPTINPSPTSYTHIAHEDLASESQYLAPNPFMLDWFSQPDCWITDLSNYPTEPGPEWDFTAPGSI
ncbi:fungal-specific transcription factor domain-containing protein [Aspergillus karnatakaensis]|uniref:transcription factor domain-containing protein n=1 Tax=Aspergillus karnatakaensis TaxID=1810916 RepID=UPI003CCDF8AD